MSFSDNQFFYASLWWLANLPGGRDHVETICERYHKECPIIPEFTPKRKPEKYTVDRKQIVSQVREDLTGSRAKTESEGLSDREIFSETLKRVLDEQKRLDEKAERDVHEALSKESLDLFFDTLYEGVRKQENVQYTTNKNHGGQYIELIQDAAVVLSEDVLDENGDLFYPHSKEIENAIKAAGIHRGRLPQSARLYIHDDGQIFVPTLSDGRASTISWGYPDRPDLKYPHLNILDIDMNSCPTLIWETVHRVVPLSEGQSHTYGWDTVDGGRFELTEEAHGEKALIVSNGDVNDVNLLVDLTDEQILAFDPAITRSITRRLHDVQPGHLSKYYNIVVHATDNPQIMRELMYDVAYMQVDQAVQIGSGSSYRKLNPGDFIVKESENSSPHAISKEAVDSGTVRFIFAPSDKVPAFKL